MSPATTRCVWRAVILFAIVVLGACVAPTGASAQQQNANAYAIWNEASWGTVTNIDQDVAVTEPADQTFWAAAWSWAGQSVGGYVGIQQKAPTVLGIGGEIALFSVWSAVSVQGVHCGAFGGEGSGQTCRIHFNFKRGRYYKLRVVRSEGSPDATRWWTASIQDTVTGKSTVIGSLSTPEPSDSITAFSNFTEYFGKAVSAPYKVPESEAMYTQPAANRVSDKPLAYQFYSSFDHGNVGAGTIGNVATLAVRGTVAARVLMGGRPKGRSRNCGYIDKTVSVVAVNVHCARAKTVAHGFEAGKSSPAGYRCSRYAVEAAAGFFAICRRGDAQVRVTPE